MGRCVWRVWSRHGLKLRRARNTWLCALGQPPQSFPANQVKLCAISRKTVGSFRCPSTPKLKTNRREPFPHLSQRSPGFTASTSSEDTVSQILGVPRATLWQRECRRPACWAVGELTPSLGSNSRYTWCGCGYWEVPSRSVGSAQTDGLGTAHEAEDRFLQ